MDNDNLEIIDLERSISFVSDNKSWLGVPKNMKDSKQRKQESTEEYRNMKQILYAQWFVDNFGVQGVRYIFMRDTTWCRRMLWLILILAGGSYCCYVTLNNINYYLTYPTTTKTSRHFHRKVEFPAVTICKYNIFQCSYQSGYCNMSHFYTKIRDIGVCFTFDPSKDPVRKYQMFPGREGGLMFGFGTNESDWAHGPFMNQEGFVVVVHDPGEQIVMVENGKNIPIGSTVSISVTRSTHSLLPYPHGECGEKKLMYYSTYSQAACQQECRAKVVLPLCGCRFEYWPENITVPVCSQFMIDACVPKILNGAYEFDGCDCPPECHRIKYDMEVTSARMTHGTTDFIKNFVAGFDMRKHGVEIRVFYPSLAYTTQIEEASYSIEKLLCDIGGAGGLFLGASFVSLFELLDFMVYSLWLSSIQLWFKRRKNKVKDLRMNV
ncbi:bile acid-sensitive ion channel-like isoform X2 [Styela clava]